MIFHILFNPFENDSRVLKETTSIAKQLPSEKVMILARGSYVKPNIEMIFDNLSVHRFFTFSEKHINLKFFKGLLLTIEWSIYCLRLIQNYEPKVIHCHDLNTLHIGFFVKLIKPKTHLIYDAHELETEQIPGNSLRKKISKIWERILISRIDSFITVNDSIKENYEYIYGVKKSIVLFNSPNRTIITQKSSELRETLKLSSSDVLYIYQGGVSEGRGIEIILEAFSRLPNYLHVVFMGSGSLEGIIKESSRKFSNIHIVPPVTYARLPIVTSGADIGLLLYENTCQNNYLCSPNKLFEYVNSEIPFICSPLYELTKLVKKFGIGVVLEKNDIDSLISAVLSCPTSNIPKESFLRLKELFSWEVQEEKLLRLYSDIIRE